MVSRDYTQEVGLPSGHRRVPLWVGGVVVALIIVAAVVAVTTLGVSPSSGGHVAVAHAAS